MFLCASRTQGFLFKLFPMQPMPHANYYRRLPCSKLTFPCKRGFSSYLPFNLVIFHVPSGFLVLPSKFQFRRGCLLRSSSKPATSQGLFCLTCHSLGHLRWNYRFPFLRLSFFNHPRWRFTRHESDGFHERGAPQGKGLRKQSTWRPERLSSGL